MYRLNNKLIKIGTSYLKEMQPPAIVYTEASGGIVTTDGDYKIHKFVSNGIFEVTQLGEDNMFEYLVVAGGGAGGSHAVGVATATHRGGGGGAGGMLEGTATNITTGSYSVVIGAGSQNSSVFGIIANAGGKGGDGHLTGTSREGQDGGSGGGAGGQSGSSPFAMMGYGIEGQGNYGCPWSSSQTFGGGGGGKGNYTINANAGVGKVSSITGSPVTYAKGGKGGSGTVSYNGLSGALNTGNGGDGCNRTPNQGYRYGGAGGIGIIILKYKYK